MKLSNLILEQVELPEGYPRHADTVIIKNEFYPDGLTEYQIWRQLHNHASDLTKQLKGRRTLLVIKTETGKIVRRNDEEGNPFEISGKDDVKKLISGRAMEFHIVADEMTDLVWIDLDPKEDYPFDEVKKVVTDLVPVLGTISKSDVSVKFSGSRGFHLISPTAKTDIDAARKTIQASVQEYIDRVGGKLSTGIVRERDAMRIDVSTLHESGSIRTAWSFHSDTGLISLPLAVDDVGAFEKADASIKLPRTLEFVPFKEDPNSTSGQMRWRQRDPDEFESFATWKFWQGIHEPGLSFIAGPLKRPKGEDAVQAIRFDRSEWTPAKAAAWWKKNHTFFDKLWSQADWDREGV